MVNVFSWTCRKSSVLFPVLFAAATAFGAGTPAAASLKVVGSSKHTALWQHIYDQFPAAWKTNQVVVVEEVPAAVLNQEAGDDGDQDGTIDGDFREPDPRQLRPATIRLSDELEDADSGFVFTHEYGHFIWCETMGWPQQREYRRLWMQQRSGGHLVTYYAADEPEEGFAESFAHFLLKPDMLRQRDDQSWQFLTALSQGKEYHAPDMGYANRGWGHRGGWWRWREDG